jgi:hypothetical protein
MNRVKQGQKIPVSPEVHEALKREAKLNGMKIYAVADRILKTGLRVHRIDVADVPNRTEA